MNNKEIIKKFAKELFNSDGWNMNMYHKTKRFIEDVLQEKDKEFIEILDSLKIKDNSLKYGKECKTFIDHEPNWDGNFYTCSKCGEQFKSVKEINQKIEDIKKRYE